MGKFTRKRHNPEFKAKVALDAMKCERTLAELGLKHGIHQAMIATWKRQAIDGLTGRTLKAALAKIGKWTVQIVKRTDKIKGFVIIPRRWVVERTFAWLGRNRRLAKDFERSIESATA